MDNLTRTLTRYVKPFYLVKQYGGINNFYYAMLGHHFDLGEGTVALLARSFFDIRESIPIWPQSESLVSSSEKAAFRELPHRLKKSVLRIGQLFDVGKTARWQPTFASFLFDLSRHRPLSVEPSPPEADRLRAITCLQIMDEELRFNICEFPSSFLLNKDLPNLEALEGANISSRLRYACRHWADQASKLETLDMDLLHMLSAFFRVHFLYWVEVMSILALSPIEALKNLDPTRVRMRESRSLLPQSH